MRLLNGLALAGLAGLARANEAAEVYILSKDSTTLSSSSSTPNIPRQVAKQIFIQRLGGGDHLSDLHGVGNLDSALSHIAQFGKAPKPLFGGAAAAAASEVAPSQLLVVFEGITDANAQELKRQLQDQSATPAFIITDTPSHQANERLLDVDLTHFAKNCDIAAAINPYDSCWEASLAVKFDLKHVCTFYSISDFSSFRSDTNISTRITAQSRLLSRTSTSCDNTLPRPISKPPSFLFPSPLAPPNMLTGPALLPPNFASVRNQS